MPLTVPANSTTVQVAFYSHFNQLLTGLPEYEDDPLRLVREAAAIGAAESCKIRIGHFLSKNPDITKILRDKGYVDSNGLFNRVSVFHGRLNDQLLSDTGMYENIFKQQAAEYEEEYRNLLCFNPQQDNAGRTQPLYQEAINIDLDIARQSARRPNGLDIGATPVRNGPIVNRYFDNNSKVQLHTIAHRFKAHRLGLIFREGLNETIDYNAEQQSAIRGEYGYAKTFIVGLTESLRRKDRLDLLTPGLLATSEQFFLSQREVDRLVKDDAERTAALELKQAADDRKQQEKAAREAALARAVEAAAAARAGAAPKKAAAKPYIPRDYAKTVIAIADGNNSSDKNRAEVIAREIKAAGAVIDMNKIPSDAALARMLFGNPNIYQAATNIGGLSVIRQANGGEDVTELLKAHPSLAAAAAKAPLLVVSNMMASGRDKELDSVVIKEFFGSKPDEANLRNVADAVIVTANELATMPNSWARDSRVEFMEYLGDKLISGLVPEGRAK